MNHIVISEKLYQLLFQMAKAKEHSSIEALIWDLLGEEFELSNIIHCDFDRCHMPAIYEGWMRVRDPFTNVSTELIRKMRVCEEHKHGLIGV